MADSFSELRNAGGSNRPWVVCGVVALIVALIGVALAAAYWSAQPKPEADTLPATVTVTAQPGARDSLVDAPSGTFSGHLNSLDPDAKQLSWPAVISVHEGAGLVTYPLTSCTALVHADGRAEPLSKRCPSPAAQGRWEFAVDGSGLLHAQYFEGANAEALVEGTLSLLAQ